MAKVYAVNLRHELGDHNTFEWVEGSLPCSIDPGWLSLRMRWSQERSFTSPGSK